MVYDDAEKYYDEIRDTGRHLLEEALSALFPSSIAIHPTEPPQHLPPSGHLIGYNTLPVARMDVVKIPITGPAAVAKQLKVQTVQFAQDGVTGYVLMDSPSGGMGISTTKGLFADMKPVSGGCWSVSCIVLEGLTLLKQLPTIRASIHLTALV